MTFGLPAMLVWVAVEEFNLSSHSMDIRYVIRFWDYGNLSYIP